MADISVFERRENIQPEDLLPQYYQIDYHIAYWILKYGIFPAAFILLEIWDFSWHGFVIFQLYQKELEV